MASQDEAILGVGEAFSGSTPEGLSAEQQAAFLGVQQAFAPQTSTTSGGGTSASTALTTTGGGQTTAGTDILSGAQTALTNPGGEIGTSGLDLINQAIAGEQERRESIRPLIESQFAPFISQAEADVEQSRIEGAKSVGSTNKSIGRFRGLGLSSAGLAVVQSTEDAANRLINRAQQRVETLKAQMETAILSGDAEAAKRIQDLQLKAADFELQVEEAGLKRIQTMLDVLNTSINFASAQREAELFPTVQAQTELELEQTRTKDIRDLLQQFPDAAITQEILDNNDIEGAVEAVRNSTSYKLATQEQRANILRIQSQTDGANNTLTSEFILETFGENPIFHTLVGSTLDEALGFFSDEAPPQAFIEGVVDSFGKEKQQTPTFEVIQQAWNTIRSQFFGAFRSSETTVGTFIGGDKVEQLSSFLGKTPEEVQKLPLSEITDALNALTKSSGGLNDIDSTIQQLSGGAAIQSLDGLKKKLTDDQSALPKATPQPLSVSTFGTNEKQNLSSLFGNLAQQFVEEAGALGVQFALNTLQEIAKTPVRAALSVTDTVRVFQGKEPLESINVPLLGKAISAQRQVLENQEEGMPPVLAMINAGSRAILDVAVLGLLAQKALGALSSKDLPPTFKEAMEKANINPADVTAKQLPTGTQPLRPEIHSRLTLDQALTAPDYTTGYTPRNLAEQGFLKNTVAQLHNRGNDTLAKELLKMDLSQVQSFDDLLAQIHGHIGKAGVLNKDVNVWLRTAQQMYAQIGIPSKAVVPVVPL